MKKGDLLKQCRKDLCQLLALKERQETLKSSVLPRAIQMQFDRIQTSPEDYFGDALAQAADLDRKISQKIMDTLDRQKEAETIIESLHDAKQKSVLMLYYLCYNKAKVNGVEVKRLYTWSAVAKRLNYSQRTVYNAHAEAMRELN